MSDRPIGSDRNGTGADAPSEPRGLLTALKQERGQLLRRLIAAEDRLTETDEMLQSLRAKHDELELQLADADTPTRSVRAPRRRRPSGTAVLRWSAVVLVAAGAGSGLSELLIDRPRRGRLANETSLARQDVARVTAEADDLRRQLATRELPGGKPPEIPVPIPTPDPKDEAKQAADLATERKILAERIARVDTEVVKLAQQKQALDLESKKLADGRKALDEERRALVKPPPEYTTPTTAAASWPMSVLVWKADVVVPTAVMVTGGSANFGSVQGRLPGKPVKVGFMPFDGVVTVIEGPSKANNWNRLYFKIDAKGPVTVVFLVWAVPAG